VLQLGVDYQGGQEDLFRCVKMRVELGREWQRGANEFKCVASAQTMNPITSMAMAIAFFFPSAYTSLGVVLRAQFGQFGCVTRLMMPSSTNALKQLKALGGGAVAESKGKSSGASASAEVAPGRKTRASVTDCCICLFSVTVCQSLFIAWVATAPVFASDPDDASADC
jgi:hypothetical protein